MDYEQSHQELVKCVVVGDTAVGKTRLICAKACNLILDLSQLMTTHIPTVWAIDQYRIHKEVLERSWEIVDGVNVSLRLWDTFGDHEKDRRFAYGRSDVVLLCFSIANPLSLRNCVTIWYPEIRKFCPNTPIVLVGCKNDLRYMFHDEKFQNLCRERSPFFRANHLCCRFPEFGRPLKECDILTPEQGRLVAKELNAVYYESSVFTGFGVKEVFENVIRAALISRRQQRFWMTNLKHVQNCSIQEPFCPPKPSLPVLKVPTSQYGQDIISLLSKQAYTDVVFVSDSLSIHCHKIVLISASDIFNTLFTYHHYNHRKDRLFHCAENASFTGDNLTKCASDISIASSVDDFDKHKHKLFNDDSMLDIRINHIKNFFSASLFFPILNFDTSKLFKHSFGKHKLFSSNKLHHSKQRFKLFQQKLITMYKNVKNPRFNSESLNSRCQSVISFGKNIPFDALKYYIYLLYTLNLKNSDLDMISQSDVVRCLRYFDFVEFDSGELRNSIDLNDKLVTKLKCYMENVKLEVFSKRFAFFGIEKGLFSDVIFKLDDGTCYAHKAVLMSRCEVMEAMFNGDFKESLAQMIVIPGVSKEHFYNVLYYIYTDSVMDTITHKNCLPLIELANRFCLIRLIALIEERVINELRQLEKHTDISSLLLKLLEPCQIHNADQLSEYCLYQIIIHYNDICHNHMKLLRALHPENQAYLNRNRWPPVWYLKEYDYFERCVREREWSENPKSYKRRKINGGCFCFSTKVKPNRNSLSRTSHGPQYTGLTYKIIGIM